ncbi:MAG: PTS glucose transporter subunit IIA [Oscillospiraceae bacterium]|nr:PTS glucose transporter subunit IIA [Oscillospiraceae bacterium]
MFFKRKKSNDKKLRKGTGMIFAVQSGAVVPVTEVSDEVFAKKILGDGVAIKPEAGTVVSPVAGTVISVADTYHAYGIKMPDGVEVLVHIGVNTVELKGKGFQSHVKVNDKVRVGTLLCDVNLSLLTKSGYDTDIVLLVTNPADGRQPITVHTGMKGKKAETCVIEYQK